MAKTTTKHIIMKSFRLLITGISLLFLALGTVTTVSAQDEARNEAINMFNNAQDLAGANEFGNAIELYRQALEVAEENGFQDIVDLVTNQLPKVYSSRASNAYKTYQSERSLESVNIAIEYYSEAQEVAEEFGDDQVRDNARAAIPQLHYIKSVLQFRAEIYEGAIESLDRAIDLNSNYATAYYQKAVVLKKMNPNDIEPAMEWYDRAIEIGEMVQDNRTVQNAREGAAEELIYRAVNLAENRNFDQAIEYLNRVENFQPESADAHYRLAEIYNQRGNWENALTHANRALELESGGVVAQAKIYFELGTAYKGQGQVNNACDAFENATYGDFSGPANHELEFELKCEGYATATGS